MNVVTSAESDLRVIQKRGHRRFAAVFVKQFQNNSKTAHVRAGRSARGVEGELPIEKGTHNQELCQRGMNGIWSKLISGGIRGVN